MTGHFAALAAAIAGEDGWTVTSDRPSPSRPGSPINDVTDVLLVFDGGSRGNPGKGYGSFAYKGRVVRWPTMMDFPGITTNNQAEYQSLIGGLRAVIFDCERVGLSPSDLALQVRSDSMLVVNQINGAWKIKNVELRDLVAKSLELLQEFGTWKLEWHSRSESVRILGH